MQFPQISPRLEPVQPLHFHFRLRQPPTLMLTQSLDHTPGRAGNVLCSSTKYNSRRGASVPSLTLKSENSNMDTKMQASSTRRVIRPLPAIPSTPSSATLCSPRSPRPLPSPPCSSPLSAKSFGGENATRVPVTSTPEIVGHPVVRRTLPCRPELPTLATNFSSLKPPENDTISLSSSLSPLPPTPQTAKRKRMDKLRRHLGEPILDEAVYARRYLLTTGTTHDKRRTAEEMAELGERLTYLRAAITVERILDMSDDESNEEAEKDEPAQDYCARVAENEPVFCGPVEWRFSRKWIHEKRGKRCEEPDYDVVLRALRSL